MANDAFKAFVHEITDDPDKDEVSEFQNETNHSL